MIENIIKTTQGTFKATVDGQELFVPNAHGNRYYQMILSVVGPQDSIPQDDSHEWHWSGTEWVQVVEPITSAMVNAERDKRLNMPFEFQGNMFDRDERSLARITGAATLAGFYLGNPENDPHSVYWHGENEPFTWISVTNDLIQMSALQMFMFGRAAANRESFLIFKAKEIKDMQPIPMDYDNDVRWS